MNSVNLVGVESAPVFLTEFDGCGDLRVSRSKDKRSSPVFRGPSSRIRWLLWAGSGNHGWFLFGFGESTATPSISIPLSRIAENIWRLIRAGALLFDLPRQIIQQRGCAEAVACVMQPSVAERLLGRDEEVQRLLHPRAGMVWQRFGLSLHLL